MARACANTQIPGRGSSILELGEAGATNPHVRGLLQHMQPQNGLMGQ